MYKTIVDHSDAGLLEIIEAAMQFEENHYITGLQERRLKHEDILVLLESVREYSSKMRRESLALAKLSETFNSEYATNHNLCFANAYDLMNRLRSTIAGSRKIFRKFCKRAGKMPTNPASAATYTVISRSTLSLKVCSQDFFGLTQYDESVQTLYAELSAFFTNLVMTLALCRRVIMDEMSIRADAKRCLAIFTDSKQAVLSSVRMMSKMMGVKTSVVSSKEYQERKAKAKSLEKLYQEYFHKLTKEEFYTLVTLLAVEDGASDGLDDEAAIVWEKDHERGLDAMFLVEHFDRLNPKLHGTRISSAYIIYYLHWAKADHRLAYDYFKHKYRGEHEVPEWHTVQTALNNITKSGKSIDKELSDFKAQVYQLLTDIKGSQIRKAG